MQITAPAPVVYLPENLWALFTRPGRELTVRVINVEGKTLFLDLGGERFSARFAGNLPPEAFKPGQSLRLRVVQTGYPVVLQIVQERAEEAKESPDLKLMYLVIHEEKGKEITGKEKISKDLKLLSLFFREIFKESEEEKVKEKKEKEEFFLKEIKHLKAYYQDGRLVLPFVFSDDKSWGYIEIGKPEEKGKKIKIFSLKLYLEFLGLVEGFFEYFVEEKPEIFISLLFSNKLACEEAKKNLSELKERILIFNKSVKININVEHKKIESGYLFEKKID